MRNDELIHAVRDELDRDPDVDGAVVAVSADDGVVRLRGTVESPAEKHEAERDAKRILAAELVDNELQVRPLGDRKDAELRGQVLQALALDDVVPAAVDVKVKDGVVTLSGIVRGQDQLDAAKLAASNIAGCREVVDQLTLTLEPNAHDVRDVIATALRRDARARAESLSIKTSHGTVTVKGKVRSWEERDTAIEAVRSLEGVRRVEDHITVES
jgi:osmotically-inducible protein OsmY